MFDCAGHVLKGKVPAYIATTEIPPWAKVLGLGLTALGVYVMHKGITEKNKESLANIDYKQKKF